MVLAGRIVLRLLVRNVGVAEELLVGALADLPVNILLCLAKSEAEGANAIIATSLTGVVVDRGFVVHSVLVELLLQLGGFGTQLLHCAVHRQIRDDQVIKLLSKLSFLSFLLLGQVDLVWVESCDHQHQV